MYRAAFFEGMWPGFPATSLPGGEEPPESIDRPILTLTSGTDNPPVFTREIPASAGEGDFLQRRIDTVDTYDSGDELSEERVLLWDGTDFVLAMPITLEPTPFTIQVGLETETPYFMSERFRRDHGDIEVYSDWSEDVTFTLDEPPVPEGLAHQISSKSYYPNGSSSAIDSSTLTFESGDKLYVVVHSHAGALDTLVGNPDGTPLVFTEIEAEETEADHRVRAFYADTSGITSATLRLTPTGAITRIGYNAWAIRGAEPGPPVEADLAADFAESGSETQIDIEGGLSLPTDGAKTYSLGSFSAMAFAGCEETGNDEVVAQLYVAGAVKSVPGSATFSGVGYSYYSRATASWAPAS